MLILVAILSLSLYIYIYLPFSLSLSLSIFVTNYKRLCDNCVFLLLFFKSLPLLLLVSSALQTHLWILQETQRSANWQLLKTTYLPIKYGTCNLDFLGWFRAKLTENIRKPLFLAIEPAIFLNDCRNLRLFQSMQLLYIIKLARFHQANRWSNWQPSMYLNK